MRTFSSNVQTALQQDVLKFAFLIELNFSSNYYLTSWPSNVTYDGDIYVADGGLFEFDSPRFSSVVDRESYKIVIGDLTEAMHNEFKSNVVGKDIYVRVALADANGDLLLGTSDVLSVYRGYVDSPSVEISDNSRIAVLEGTSPMSDLDLVNSIRTSKDSMDQLSATDTSFDEIFDRNTTALRWGKY